MLSVFSHYLLHVLRRSKSYKKDAFDVQNFTIFVRLEVRKHGLKNVKNGTKANKIRPYVVVKESVQVIVLVPIFFCPYSESP